MNGLKGTVLRAVINPTVYLQNRCAQMSENAPDVTSEALAGPDTPLLQGYKIIPDWTCMLWLQDGNINGMHAVYACRSLVIEHCRNGTHDRSRCVGSSLSRDWAGLGLSVGMGRGATSAMWSNRLLSYLSLMWY